MNIIGNSCASSYIVRDLLKEPFSNPFVWCSVSEADILYIVANYTKINWQNINISLYGNHTHHTQNVHIVVDNKIQIKYPHYCLSNCATKVDGINVFSKDIVQWAKDKYLNRCERMMYAGNPFFILGGSWEDQMMSMSTFYLYSNQPNVYLLNTLGVLHDNYKVAMKNFPDIQPRLLRYFNDSNSPNI